MRAVQAGNWSTNLAPVQIKAGNVLGRCEGRAREGIAVHNEGAPLAKRSQHGFPGKRRTILIEDTWNGNRMTCCLHAVEHLQQWKL